MGLVTSETVSGHVGKNVSWRSRNKKHGSLSQRQGLIGFEKREGKYTAKEWGKQTSMVKWKGEHAPPLLPGSP